jgi:hypothetical protein
VRGRTPAVAALLAGAIFALQPAARAESVW